MTWLKTDDAYYDHAKIAALGSHEYRLHHGAQLLAARMESDGRVTKWQVEGLRRRGMPPVAKLTKALVDAGLWHCEGDEFVIHDFLDYNPSRAEIEARRAADAERKAEWRARRAAQMSQRDTDIA